MLRVLLRLPVLRAYSSTSQRYDAVTMTLRCRCDAVAMPLRCRCDAVTSQRYDAARLQDSDAEWMFTKARGFVGVTVIATLLCGFCFNIFRQVSTAANLAYLLHSCTPTRQTASGEAAQAQLALAASRISYFPPATLAHNLPLATHLTHTCPRTAQRTPFATT